MDISAKELRKRPGKILEIVNSGEDVVITYRGKPSAVIKRIEPVEPGPIENGAFGIWSDYKEAGDVDAFVRNIRKGRSFDR